jgi:hypothetical protein
MERIAGYIESGVWEKIAEYTMVPKEGVPSSEEAKQTGENRWIKGDKE